MNIDELVLYLKKARVEKWRYSREHARNGNSEVAFNLCGHVSAYDEILGLLGVEVDDLE